MIVPLLLALGLVAARDVSALRVICSSCTGSVEQALRKLDGVVEVKADIRKDAVLVKYNEKKVTPRKMLEALRKAGYPARLPVR